jgi:glutathione S-transferase
MLELYHSGGTTCSKQVRQHLTEKGISYTTRFVELWRYQNLSPEYLRLNPNGVVPTLVHDGKPIINSFCIMEYIEDVFPENPLRPADLAVRAKQRHWSWLADEIHPTVANVTYSVLMRKRHQEMDRETVEWVAARMPVPERRERFLTVANQGYPPEAIEEAWHRIDFVLGQFDEAIGAGPWACGAQYTLADVSMLAIVARMGEINPKLVDKTRRPRLADWLTRSLARPAVQKVYAAVSDESPARPTGKFSIKVAAAR